MTFNNRFAIVTVYVSSNSSQSCFFGICVYHIASNSRCRIVFTMAFMSAWRSEIYFVCALKWQCYSISLFSYLMTITLWLAEIMIWKCIYYKMRQPFLLHAYLCCFEKQPKIFYVLYPVNGLCLVSYNCHDKDLWGLIWSQLNIIFHVV